MFSNNMLESLMNYCTDMIVCSRPRNFSKYTIHRVRERYSSDQSERDENFSVLATQQRKQNQEQEENRKFCFESIE
jgi:hypothetical protein